MWLGMPCPCALVHPVVEFDVFFVRQDRNLLSQIEMVLDGFASQEDAGIMTQKLFSDLPQARCVAVRTCFSP